VSVHYRGVGSERRRLAAVPAVGTYLYGPGADRRLWQVSAVAIDGESVALYALELSARLAAELTAAWAAWGEPIAAVDEAPAVYSRPQKPRSETIPLGATA